MLLALSGVLYDLIIHFLDFKIILLGTNSTVLVAFFVWGLFTMPRITTGKKRSTAQIEATRLMGHSAHEEPAIVVPALAENVSANIAADSAHAGPSVGEHTLIELMQTLALKDGELQAKDAVIDAQNSALKSTKILLDQS